MTINPFAKSNNNNAQQSPARPTAPTPGGLFSGVSAADGSRFPSPEEGSFELVVNKTLFHASKKTPGRVMFIAEFKVLSSSTRAYPEGTVISMKSTLGGWGDKYTGARMKKLAMSATGYVDEAQFDADLIAQYGERPKGSPQASDLLLYAMAGAGAPMSTTADAEALTEALRIFGDNPLEGKKLHADITPSIGKDGKRYGEWSLTPST